MLRIVCILLVLASVAAMFISALKWAAEVQTPQPMRNTSGYYTRKRNQYKYSGCFFLSVALAAAGGVGCYPHPMQDSDSPIIMSSMVLTMLVALTLSFELFKQSAKFRRSLEERTGTHSRR